MTSAPTAESRRGAAARVVLLLQHPKPISSSSSYAPRISDNCSSRVVPGNLKTVARICTRRSLLAAAARRGPWLSTLGKGAIGAVAATGGMHESWIMDVIRGLYCLLNVSKVRNDGFVSRLHVLTAVLLLTFFAMVSMKQAVGNPIDCVHTRDIPVEAFNAYCWIHSTYFVTGAMLGVAGVNVAFPGVGPTHLFHQRQRSGSHQQSGPSDHRSTGTDPHIRQVKYYQWVPFFLIFQNAAHLRCFKTLSNSMRKKPWFYGSGKREVQEDL